MLHFNFDYYRPSTIKEAVDLFVKLDKKGKKPIYFSGGTEVTTLGRLNLIHTKAVIDVKGIPECNALEIKENSVVVGAAHTLTRVFESKIFPLLGEACVRIADRTSRNQITFGGNLASDIIYREAILPLLLSNSTLVIAGIDGVKEYPVEEIFNEKLRLKRGEFLVQTKSDGIYRKFPFFIDKKRKSEKVDYPLITLELLKVNRAYRLAISGLCAYPFRSYEMEQALNNTNLSALERINQAILAIPAPVISDIRGSREYRIFVLRNLLLDGLVYLGGVRA
ncbi:MULTISPECIES: FAD binding domain-containing protein [Bacillaceae]|uniref:FAD binding domain-containing protein n=1 Tax=Bacillaceae TaxID=186817 RepID=UPI000BEBC4E2|nr:MULTISPECIES: FAD binding domain-containing protein [unclassified Bacillus (in: firmicutes)]PEC49133.1 xanthine dehydrogenase [Bacillus sp. AFS096315]PFM75450.1 xanthine dehydrogenase [Bacillus sp. AFS077874]